MEDDVLSKIYYCMERIIVFDGIDDVLQHVVKTASSLTASDAATIRLFNLQTGKLDIKAGIGLSSDFLAQPPLELGEGIIGKVVQDCKEFISTDVTKESHCSQKDLAQVEGINSILSVPLKNKEKAIGSLSIYRKSSKAFTDSELLLMSIFAAQAVEAVEKTNQLESLKKQAIFDQLTDVYNRHYVIKRLDEEIKRANRFNHPITITFIDIDDFKKFNDKHGHLLGDKLLKDFTQLIRKGLRKNDLLGRYGGEEFLLVTPETDKEGAQAIANKLLALTKKYSFLGCDGDVTGVSFSAGISCYPEDGTTSEELIDIADKAMYEAKKRGKKSVVLSGKQITA
ncbi:MAG: GGDEF domain-containing protein [Proteobacteria bacterium]|nr:GGDEF domain-containing protein [Pseudomonadota bacterium]